MNIIQPPQQQIYQNQPQQQQMPQYPNFPPPENQVRYSKICQINIKKLFYKEKKNKNRIKLSNKNRNVYDLRTAATFLNPKSIQKKAKFCPICDYPASVRVVINPCRHFMCYECYYVDGQTFCKFCNDIVGSVKRLEDTEKFYSCEFDTCFKYFDSDQQLEDHNSQHAIILG